MLQSTLSSAQSSNTRNKQISSARLHGLWFPWPELDNSRSPLHQHPSRSSLDSLSFRCTGCPMDQWCVYWADWSDGSTLSAGEQQGGSVRLGCWSLWHRWKLVTTGLVSWERTGPSGLHISASQSYSDKRTLLCTVWFMWMPWDGAPVFLFERQVFYRMR